jgi:hypothetical protein
MAWVWPAEWTMGRCGGVCAGQQGSMSTAEVCKPQVDHRVVVLRCWASIGVLASKCGADLDPHSAVLAKSTSGFPGDCEP